MLGSIYSIVPCVTPGAAPFFAAVGFESSGAVINRDVDLAHIFDVVDRDVSSSASAGHAEKTIAAAS